MHPLTFLSTALFLSLLSALPLNINLGAYSPALVVGDGVIEFEGSEATEGLASKSAPNAQQTTDDEDATVLPTITLPTITLPVTLPVPRTTLATKKRQDDGGNPGLAGLDRALQFAEVALTKGPDIQLGTAGHGAGVGIIVDNNNNNNRGPGGGGAGESVVVPLPFENV
ncbi:hypothetical protein B0T18DRAFT_430906 [Schizothecium vesticola]|uniref:Uncharacterized protein n=1 Tax=Schizothecium vesticola TaxID=314040 RepID=A0AA40K2N1_9PEZI|nr:hypothetical protein B0T18DRAFT_430906 [Schizothecium vesticola]